MNFLKNIFNSKSIPVIFISIGLFSLLYSIWGTFENDLWKETWGSIGKTILASGIFAGLLKLMQISGVYKEELEKLIFEPRFLKNRLDIPSYWEKISQELFKNKFPNISKKLLSDIKDTYFPTKTVTYYDQMEHFLEIEIDDHNILTIKQKTSLEVICSNKNDNFEYQFTNSLIYNESPEEVSFTCNEIKVNGEIFTGFKHEQVSDNKLVTNKFTLKLKGSEKYEIERKEIKKYSLDVDNLINFTAAKLTNSLLLSISHSKLLDFKFIKVGTLKNFVEKQNNATFKKYEYKDILYEEQGYLLVIYKK